MLEIIYGRSGCGKSEYIYNKIKNNIDDNGKSYIITPEQFSFTAEKKLLEVLKEGATTKVEVLSFERMAYRVVNEVLGRNTKNLIASSKAMIIYSLLSEYQKDLKFLNETKETVDLILTQITEFKKHNITVDMLKKQIEKTNDEYLKLKLKDMLLIYEKFEDIIIEEYIDENDLLTILAKNIEKSHLFDGAIFYIDEFAGFTKQEYSVISSILKIAKKVYITVCTDDLRVISSPEVDIFYDNKQTIQSLKKIGEIDKGVFLDKNYRFKNDELKHLEKNIYNVPYEVYKNDIYNINLTVAKNQYEEIEYVARQIFKLVRDYGYRYKDIGIVTKNLDVYSSLCKAIFGEYDIPVFIDETKDITQDIFIKYVLSILDIFSKNWSYEAVFNYLKTGIVNIDKIYELENYCLKWDIRGKKWYEKPWDYGDDEHFKNEQIKIITPLLELKEKLKGIKTADKISKCLYDFILKNTSDNESYIDIESYNIVIDALDEISVLFKDKKITFDTYIKLLKVGIANKKIGQIPQTQDKVTVGDINRSKTHKVKAIFIIGVNDEDFPSVASNEGFFNDKDREILKQEGLELAKGTLEKMYEENFNIYKSFSTAEEKLYISYAVSDVDDKAIRRSSIISKIKKIFPKLEEKIYNPKDENIYTKEVTFSNLLENISKIDNDWYEVYNWFKNDKEWNVKLNNALKGLEYTNIPEKINKENVQKLYGDTLYTTVSRLEKYRSCGFAYYLKYGLKLSDKEKMDIKPINTGTFMHEVIDTFFKQVHNIKEISEDEMSKILDEIIEEKISLKKNYIFTVTAKYRILVKRLKKVIFMSMKYILRSLKNSEFNVFKSEFEFGNNDCPPIEIDLNDGKKAFITGKIDRIDVAKMPNGKYIRIIDYKSSSKDIEFNKLIAGLELQLLTYSDAITKLDNANIAGILYFSLLEINKIADKKEMSKEEIEEIIRKNYRMNGLILADINVIKMMDTTLKEGKSDIIPVTLNSNEQINEKSSKTLTKEEFEILQKYTIKLIKQISQEILDGEIKLKPYYIVSGKKTPCMYCEYKSICQFNPKNPDNNYFYISNKSKKEILEQIAKEVK